MNTAKYVKGFIAGSLIGIATGLLLIPQSNKNMGSKLVDNLIKR